MHAADGKGGIEVLVNLTTATVVRTEDLDLRARHACPRVTHIAHDPPQAEHTGGDWERRLTSKKHALSQGSCHNSAVFGTASSFLSRGTTFWGGGRGADWRL